MRPPWSPTPPIFPAFGGAWGQPFLFGPGSIHVAHTAAERIPKREILEAIEIYKSMVKELMTQMNERIPVGILGATGMVGQEFVSFLEDHPWFDLTWLGASDRSAGKQYRDATTWRLGGDDAGARARHRW